MAYLLFFAIGLIVGMVIMIVNYKRQTMYGKINVDHYSELISIFADRDELKKMYKKRAIFTIDHNAIISRDEHTL